MSKILTKLSAILLSIAMAFGMITVPEAVYAEETSSTPTFDADSSYALISKSTGKAVRVNEESWQDQGAVYVDGTITADKKVKEKSEFKVITNEDGTYSFASVANNKAQLKSENILEEGIRFVFNLSQGEGANKFTLEEVQGGYKIKNSSGAYLGLGENNRLDKVDIQNAETFSIEKISGVLDEYVSIQNVETKKYVSFKDQESLKPIKVDAETASDTEKFLPSHQENDNHETIEGIKKDEAIDAFGLQSKSNTKLAVISANWNDGTDDAIVAKETTPGKWESIVLDPNGDGTVSIRSSYSYRYATINDKNELEFCDKTKEQLTAKEKFIIHSDTEPAQVDELSAKPAARSVKLTWKKVSGQIISGYEVYRATSKDAVYEKIADDVATNTYLDTTSEPSNTYYYKVRAINGLGNVEETTPVKGEFSDILEVQTLKRERPFAPSDLKIEQVDGKNSVKLTWKSSGNQEGTYLHYVIYAASSAYGIYKPIDEVENTSCTIDYTEGVKGTKYQYYKVAAKDTETDLESDLVQDQFVSLETKMFGDHTLIFSDQDDIKVVDKILKNLFDEQNDSSKDAQFKADHYQVYFKPGDYKETSCINLGFYTAINGLGKTPDDVELNNISIPAYLTDDNATCNFWRSIENFKVVNTGNKQGEAGNGSYRGQQLNWAVAQAAPMRRIHSERAVAYDWNYGWASGGYVADSKIDGTFTDNGNQLSAGTFSGQQFYTRNSELAGNAYGTTLNNFFQGVIAPNLPTAKDGESLANDQGYSNWGIKADDGGQQVFTNIEKTEKIAEKPFLYMKDGEYQVFVPSVSKDSKGVSWGDGKANDGMGEGKSIPLSDFYIASPKDSAKTINEQIEKGKSIYLTPGVYKVEEPINVSKEGTIILGTGMATIIPENDEAAMKVADVDGVRIAGIIFDAGKDSKYLLEVGDKKTNKDHEKDPTILTDLFFRVGGTTSSATKAENALVINNNDTLTDHFWIWRADHGAGVSWKGNASQHGLVVNGDNVKCYALFNEHFENYTTLWNGENGATYFYQNETAYDAITQDEKNSDAWLSHNGAVKGYASYKVANNVKKHYAVGLGIYNVFIYTGGGAFDTEKYDGGAQIVLDNAIEVPNQKDVIVENACMQTFAKDGEEGGLYQTTKSIINGVGGSVSSGYKREESRADDGSLNGALLDKKGNKLPTKIYKKQSKNEHGKAEFEYLVREVDDEGQEIILVDGKEIDYDKLKAKGYTYNINEKTGAFTVLDQDGKNVDYASDKSLFRKKSIRKAVSGKGWNRVFITRYQNGEVSFGDDYAESVDNVTALGDDSLDMETLSKTVKEAKELKSEDYTKESWKTLEDAVKAAQNTLSANGKKYTFKDTDNTVVMKKGDIEKEVVFTSYNKTLETLTTAIKDLEKAKEPTEPTEPEVPGKDDGKKDDDIKKDDDNKKDDNKKDNQQNSSSTENTSSTTATTKPETSTRKNQKSELKLNKTITIKGITYKVTKVKNAKNGEVKVIKINKKKKTASIPATIKIDQATCKVVSIGKKAANKCKKLKKVTIGKNVKTIESKAFYGCKKLKSIKIKSKLLKKPGKQSIKGIHKKAVIKVPKKKYKKYKKYFGKKTGFKKTMKIKKTK